jgi:two-component system, NtrC family, sensor kinase
MSPENYRILLIEPDPSIGNFLNKQLLYPLGYRVKRVDSASDAMLEVANNPPDLIIANLSLPGLSGNDLLVALASQGIDIPVVVMAKKGMENSIIQAFRLGACDYISLPLRETEVVTVTERVLDQKTAQIKREKLISELKATNQDFDHQLRRTIATLTILKDTAQITNLKTLFEKILEVALQVTDTQRGWILMRDGRNNKFVMVSYQSSLNLISTQDLPWENNFNPLDSILGESQSMDKDKPHVFELKSPDGSTLVAPIQSFNTLIGLLIVMRCNPHPFTTLEPTLLEAIAHQTTCSITKLRLIQSVNKPTNVRKK